MLEVCSEHATISFQPSDATKAAKSGTQACPKLRIGFFSSPGTPLMTIDLRTLTLPIPPMFLVARPMSGSHEAPVGGTRGVGFLHHQRLPGGTSHPRSHFGFGDLFLGRISKERIP